MKKAILALASGRTFSGFLFGADPAETGTGGEVVFNTSMTGYQEILTDPSYQGQIVVMTASHIGNTGINQGDVESRKIFLSGFVIQELSPITSNWRSEQSLDAYLKEAGVTGIAGVDTRALTRYLRTQGAVNGLISTDVDHPQDVLKKAKALPSMEGQDLVKFVTSKEKYNWDNGSGKWTSYGTNLKAKGPSSPQRHHVVVMDFGVKQNILRCLNDMNCDVTVVPASTSSSDILNLKPDGVLLSNGPGDPAPVEYGIKTIKELVENNENREKKGEKGFSIFGICLGHQLLGLALGAKTTKLKFGHHGSNHPVKDLTTGVVEVTSQNHGFCVTMDGNKKGNWDVTHINLNDQAVEGLAHKTLPIFSVQYHPESSAGPHDSRYLFNRFIKSMEN